MKTAFKYQGKASRLEAFTVYKYGTGSTRPKPKKTIQIRTIYPLDDIANGLFNELPIPSMMWIYICARLAVIGFGSWSTRKFRDSCREVAINAGNFLKPEYLTFEQAFRGSIGFVDTAGMGIRIQTRRKAAKKNIQKIMFQPDRFSDICIVDWLIKSIPLDPAEWNAISQGILYRAIQRIDHEAVSGSRQAVDLEMIREQTSKALAKRRADTLRAYALEELQKMPPEERRDFLFGPMRD